MQVPVTISYPSSCFSSSCGGLGRRPLGRPQKKLYRTVGFTCHTLGQQERSLAGLAQTGRCKSNQGLWLSKHFDLVNNLLHAYSCNQFPCQPEDTPPQGPKSNLSISG